MKRREEPELSPALPIAYERRPPGAVIGINALILEGVGQIPAHLWGWSPWIGQQLPIVYLLWKIAQERDMRWRVVRAWNKRLEPERPAQPPETSEDILKRILDRDDQQP